MKTFSITTLGCKVNQYESEQIAVLLRSRGLVRVESDADLEVINTCSVTVQASGKSRQTVRRQARAGADGRRPRVVVAGCWATSNPAEAAALMGVDAVLGHHDDLARQLNGLLDEWGASPSVEPSAPPAFGTTSLPLLGQRQTGHQRAFLKIQDGCDAHCTYCIIPKLRPKLWSKPPEDAVQEARRLVAAGHMELVLTGIFLGAYGQSTALHRRQLPLSVKPLARLIDALCQQVPGLRRLRLSSLEPADLTPDLIATLRRHPQVVPHFHLPLQSGSDVLLHRMNRQYRRDDFLRMVEQLRAAFDRPALTTDVIVGFPGETDKEFARTMDVVERVGFIHIHAFPYSPRPGTAAARWTDEFIAGPVVNRRINLLRQAASACSLKFRTQFLDTEVELLVERPSAEEREVPEYARFRHGRCERYFSVTFEGPESLVGQSVRVRIDRVTPHRTLGKLVSPSGAFL